MPDVDEKTKIFPITSFSGIQSSVNRFLQRDADLSVAQNATFTTKIGTIGKKPGYIQQGTDLTSTTSTSTSTSTSSSSSTSTSTTTS